MSTSDNEIIQIVDRHNRKIGHRTRASMRAEKLLPRASYIFVFNDNDELFLQKRTATKDIYPGHWDVMAGGVVLADESYEDGARRELSEELGIDNVPLRFLFDHYYENGSNRVWGRVFTCRHNGPFTLQPSEIAAGMFLPPAEILQLKEKEPFAPNGLALLDTLLQQRQTEAGDIIFLHGLDSSGKGTKGRFFHTHFPHVLCPDFHGTLDDRMAQLSDLCRDKADLMLIGSSFGGLMASLYALRFPEKTARLILLAPALNFGGFQPPAEKIQVKTRVIIGTKDTVTPPAKVIPLARQTFAHLHVDEMDDDHLLHESMIALPWHELLMR